MASTITSIVDPDNGTGTDYTSMHACQDDLWGGSGGFVFYDWIADIQCRNSSGGEDTTFVHCSDQAGDATRYLQIGPVSGYACDGTWDTSNYHLSVYGDRVFDCENTYTRFDHLQFEIEYPASEDDIIFLDPVGTSNVLRVSNCFFNQKGSLYYDVFGVSARGNCGANTKVWNSIFTNIHGYNGGGAVQGNVGDVDVYNCIAHLCGESFQAGSGGSCDCINCAAIASTDTDWKNIYPNYCISMTSYGGSPQTPSGADWDNEFTDISTGDYTLVSGGNCIGNGYDNPGSGLYSDDIIGTTRSSTWDIGAFEYVSTGWDGGKVTGVDGPGKVTGVGKEDILKVIGVA